MGFDIPKLKQKFIQKYPALINVYDWWYKLTNIKQKKNNYEIDKTVLKQKLGNKLYKDIISLFSKCIDFHNHIFRASEAYRKNFYAFSKSTKRFQRLYYI